MGNFLYKIKKMCESIVMSHTHKKIYVAFFTHPSKLTKRQQGQKRTQGNIHELAYF